MLLVRIHGAFKIFQRKAKFIHWKTLVCTCRIQESMWCLIMILIVKKQHFPNELYRIIFRWSLILLRIKPYVATISGNIALKWILFVDITKNQRFRDCGRIIPSKTFSLKIKNSNHADTCESSFVNSSFDLVCACVWLKACLNNHWINR